MSISFDDFLKRVKGSGELLFNNTNIAMTKNALRMEADGKLNATTFPRVQTGRLRNSIQGIVGTDFSGNLMLILRAGGLNFAGDNPTINPPADVEYAKIQEEGGTSFFMGRDIQIIPKFYLRRARDKNLSKYKEDITKAGKLALEGKAFR